jgi:hypothetical protein
MIATSLNSLNKLDILEELEQKKHEEKIRQELQLLVSISEISVSTNTP